MVPKKDLIFTESGAGLYECLYEVRENLPEGSLAAIITGNIF